MKKIIILFSIIVCNGCFAQGILIIDSVNHNPTWAGDSLTIYLHTYGNSWGSAAGYVEVDVAGIVVFNKNVANIPVGNHQWKILFPNILPSVTSAYINMDDGGSYQYDAFFVQVDNTLNILSTQMQQSIESKKYYSINGVLVDNPSGVVIELLKFSDGTIRMKKCIFPEKH